MRKVHQLQIYGSMQLHVGDLLEVVETRGDTLLVSVVEKTSPTADTPPRVPAVVLPTSGPEPPALGVSVSEEIQSEESIG